MASPVSLAPDEARKLVLLSQGVLTPERRGRAVDATLGILRHLGYVQIDTISVVERAHHHTLWIRNPRYRHAHLDQLLAAGEVFEYWSHAAAWLPMRDYRFALPRMLTERQGAGRWHRKNPRLMRQVLDRIRSEGPLMSRDFEDSKPGSRAMWEWKPAKYALEQLFIEGRIMTRRREGFNKVYDLAERVLPPGVDTSPPDAETYGRYLVETYLRANGLGRIPEFIHLRKGMRETVEQVVGKMLVEGELVESVARGHRWLMFPHATGLLDRPLPRERARLLSPFDNLVIQRRRIGDLFDFDYQLECYVPAEKRTYGYFVMPVLWRGRLVARVDLKAHRDRGVLEMRNLVAEKSLRARDRFARALAASLGEFAAFNGCSTVTTGHCHDHMLARRVAAHWRSFGQ